jgi:hypothetical protein
MHEDCPSVSIIVPSALKELTSHTLCSKLHLNDLADAMFPGLFESDELGFGAFLGSLPGFVDVFYNLLLL